MPTLRDERYWLFGWFGARAGFEGEEIWMVEYLEPSGTEASQMFALGRLGVTALVEGLQRDVFPATKGRVRKRGAKRVAAALATPQGVRAATFLAHALPAHQAGWWRGLHYASVDEPRAYFQDPVWHGHVRGRLGAYFPLGPDDEDALERCQARHRAFEGQIATNHLEDTGFTLELKGAADPTALLGLSDEHRTASDMFFEAEALHHAIRIVLGHDEYEALQADLTHGYGPFVDLAYLAGLSSFWADLVSEYYDVLVPAEDRLGP